MPTNTTTVLYNNGPALVKDEPQHNGTDEGSARDNEICMPGLHVTYPSNSEDADAAGPAVVSQDWDGPSQNTCAARRETATIMYWPQLKWQVAVPMQSKSRRERTYCNSW